MTQPCGTLDYAIHYVLLDYAIHYVLLDYAIHYVLLDYAIRSVRRLVNKVLQCVGAKASE